MAEQNESPRTALKSTADQTLIGVPAPRVDSDPDSRLHSPVLVRAGTSAPEAEPAPLPPQVALPSRPPSTPSVSDARRTAIAGGATGIGGLLGSALDYVGRRPLLGMLALPVACALLLVALGRHAPRSRTAVNEPSRTRAQLSPELSSANTAKVSEPSVTELEQRPAGSLLASEVLRVAAAKAEQKRAQASELRQRLALNPALGQDNAVQAKLLEFAEDPITAPEALAAMSALEPPLGADLLYAVWTRTTERTDTTELARSLLYSSDVKAKASPALAVALALRAAETCAEFHALLPKALTDGDRRSQHLLAKLIAKRGCGPKKTEDCYACLRANRDELNATINAVKSRHAPDLAANDNHSPG